MPSPIAHGSLVFVADALLGQDKPRDIRKPIIWAMLLFASVAPDFDIALNWISSGEPFAGHGSYSHSLLLAPLFGVLFVCAMKIVWREAKPGRVFAIGTGLYAAHVLMDLVTHDSRGVALLWPIIPDRIASPIGIFTGVNHSDWSRFDLHLITLITETLFAALIFGITKYITGIRRGYKAHA